MTNKKILGTQIRTLEEYRRGLKPLVERIVTEMTESRRNKVVISFGEVVDIMSRAIHGFYEDSLESIVCGTSMAIFQEGISTNLSIEPGEETSFRYCLYFNFSPAKPNENAPTLDSCGSKWSKLAELPTENRIKIYKKAMEKLIPNLKVILTQEKARGHDTVNYLVYFIGDIMGEFIGKEDEFINDNIVSIFCGIAPTLYDNGISIDINLLYNYHCFSFSFRDINTGDKRPTTETCLEKWAKLFIEK